MTKYLCAITLPVHAAIAIREIQESYKSSSWNISIEPHITIVPPGTALASLDQAEALMRSAIAGQMPFDVSVRGIGIFDNDSNTVIANVELSEELAKLQYELYCASIGFVAKPNVRSEKAGNRFHPHVTISNKLNPALAKQIAAQLEEQRIDFSFRCESVALFSKEPQDSVWTESRRLFF